MQDCGERNSAACRAAILTRLVVCSGFARRARRDAANASSVLRFEWRSALPLSRHRRTLGSKRGPLFLSESRRNYAGPISIWIWSKIVLQLARRAGIERFSTHTLRHLCLTDLARAGWDIHEIATFAGHRSVQTTLLYIHLSGRDLSLKLAAGMAQIHARRAQMLAEVGQ